MGIIRMNKIEKVSYWRDPDLEGLEVCRVRSSSHIFPNHAHDGIYAIGLMEKGGSWCLGPGREEAFVAAGQLALINPGQVHSGVPASGCRMTYRMIYVTLNRFIDLAVDVCERAGTIPEFQRMVIPDPRFFVILNDLCRLMDKPGRRLQKQSVALEAFAPLLSTYGGVTIPSGRTGRQRRAIRRAKEFLSENLEAKLSLAEVAAAVGLSRYHFLRVFKQETGLPPHVFRTQRRIDAAQRLLKKGMPFSQVALSAGFNDQSHFTNKFRQFMGATPSQYLSRKHPPSVSGIV
jgi:AraC-like DNA-binding protein